MLDCIPEIAARSTPPRHLRAIFQFPRYGSITSGGRFYFASTNYSNEKGMTWSRPESAFPWIDDSSGLGTRSIYSITGLRSGAPLVGTLDTGLWRGIAPQFKSSALGPAQGNVINGVTWSKIPSPPGLESASSFSVSVDSGGAIFSAFSVFNGFTYVGRGVYVTLDTGATWTYAGLDSVSILSLLSYGTTTYACTFDHGLYAFERGVSTGVDNPPVVPARMELEQNYPNPFNPTTMIRFTIPERALVKLYVYNVLGQEVASLINEERAPGAYEVRFDARGLSSGAYFYLLRAGSYVQLKKLLILR